MRVPQCALRVRRSRRSRLWRTGAGPPGPLPHRRGRDAQVDGRRRAQLARAYGRSDRSRHRYRFPDGESTRRVACRRRRRSTTPIRSQKAAARIVDPAPGGGHHLQLTHRDTPVHGGGGLLVGQRPTPLRGQQRPDHGVPRMVRPPCTGTCRGAPDPASRKPRTRGRRRHRADGTSAWSRPGTSAPRARRPAVAAARLGTGRQTAAIQIHDRCNKTTQKGAPARTARERGRRGRFTVRRRHSPSSLRTCGSSSSGPGSDPDGSPRPGCSR